MFKKSTGRCSMFGKFEHYVVIGAWKFVISRWPGQKDPAISRISREFPGGGIPGGGGRSAVNTSVTHLICPSYVGEVA
jgi:hypothetical protein